MKIIRHVENIKGPDAEDIMNGIINKVLTSAYGKDIKKIILIPIKNNSYSDLQIEVHYKRRKELNWKP